MKNTETMRGETTLNTGPPYYRENPKVVKHSKCLVNNTSCGKLPDSPPVLRNASSVFTHRTRQSSYLDLLLVFLPPT